MNVNHRPFYCMKTGLLSTRSLPFLPTLTLCSPPRTLRTTKLCPPRDCRQMLQEFPPVLLYPKSCMSQDWSLQQLPSWETYNVPGKP